MAASQQELAQLRAQHAAELEQLRGDLADLRVGAGTANGVGPQVDDDKELRSIVDTRVLAKVHQFSGEDTDWRA